MPDDQARPWDSAASPFEALFQYLESELKALGRPGYAPPPEPVEEVGTSEATEPEAAPPAEDSMDAPASPAPETPTPE